MTVGRGRAGALVPAVCALFLTGCAHPRPAADPTPPAAVSPRTPSHAIEELTHTLDGALGVPQLERGTWGVLVRSLSRNDTLYAKNAASLLIPASNLKVVTLAVAAEKLGWSYTYETRVFIRGAIEAGVLNGDLIVVGTGDPSLAESDGSAQRVFQSWADGLKKLGITAISGRIIGDDNAFDDEGFGAGWMWDDMDQAYSASIGALQVNVDAMALTIAPGDVVGAPASLTLASDGSGLTIHSQVMTAAAGTPARIVTRRLANRPVLEVSGIVAVQSSPVQRTVAVENPTLYYVSVLRRALVADGIEVRGAAADIDDIDDLTEAPGHRDAAPLFSHRSPPLSELADTLMKISQNQYAETLLKTLGASAGGATFEGGRKVVRETLESWGVPPSDIVYADGSGLSRYDLVSARAMVAVLTHVASDPGLKSPFEASLPAAGVAGMLSERLKGTAAAGAVRAKTGSMANVRSISGFMTTAEGEPVVFSIIANNFGVSAAEIDRVADALLLDVAQFRR